MKKEGKRKALAALVCGSMLTVALVGGTLAYLQDDDSDVNVMTLGSVYIDQVEQERIDIEKLPTSDNLTEFKDKPLFPAVYDGDSIPWNADSASDQAWKVVEDNANVIDKFVTVKNTGKSEAYVRTVIGYEGNLEYGPEGAWIHVVHNGDNVDPAIVINLVGVVKVNDVEYTAYEYVYPSALAAGDTSVPSLKQVYMDKGADNKVVEKYGETYEIIAVSQAVQTNGFSNAKTALDTAFGEATKDNVAGWLGGAFVDTWDGTVDTSWYNDTDTEFTIATAAQLAGLAELVDGGNDFTGKTIKLGKDLDLYAEGANGEPVSFEPIGSFSDDKTFEGTFDGQNHTISNLYQSGWALENGVWDGPEYGMGLFSLVENATVKNVNFEGASLPTEANIIGVVAGGAANCVFENINITGAYLGNHSWYSGGAIGWAEGDVKLINCDIDATSVVSSQWGDFNNANGGLIGGIDDTSTIYLKDCDVACVIDAYNDVTSAYEWYSYRNCGMLIGDTGQKDDPDGDNVGNAIAPNLTCENVTVTYGTWANYHYCEFGSAGYPFCRVEAGESTGAYGNARVGEYTDANGNKVVDDNHAHNTDEKHNELIVFDQLYGGATGDRYCTYGTTTHDGVTVIYNNK